MCGNVTATVLLLSPSVRPLYRAVLSTPNAALMNAMACRVFRTIKFGDYLENHSSSSPTLTRPAFASAPSGGVRQPGSNHASEKGRRQLTQIVFQHQSTFAASVEDEPMFDSSSKGYEV